MIEKFTITVTFDDIIDDGKRFKKDDKINSYQIS